MSKGICLEGILSDGTLSRGDSVQGNLSQLTFGGDFVSREFFSRGFCLLTKKWGHLNKMCKTLIKFCLKIGHDYIGILPGGEKYPHTIEV